MGRKTGFYRMAIQDMPIKISGCAWAFLGVWSIICRCRVPNTSLQDHSKFGCCILVRTSLGKTSNFGSKAWNMLTFTPEQDGSNLCGSRCQLGLSSSWWNRRILHSGSRIIMIRPRIPRDLKLWMTHCNTFRSDLLMKFTHSMHNQGSIEAYLIV